MIVDSDSDSDSGSISDSSSDSYHYYKSEIERIQKSFLISCQQDLGINQRA